MEYYFLPSVMVFFALLFLFMRDNTTPKTQLYSWVVVLAGALVWPLTVVVFLGKKLQEKTNA